MPRWTADQATRACCLTQPSRLVDTFITACCACAGLYKVHLYAFHRCCQRIFFSASFMCLCHDLQEPRSSRPYPQHQQIPCLLPRQHGHLAELGQPITLAAELRALRQLKHVCEAMLAIVLPTSMQQDGQLLQDNSLSEGLRLAVRWRWQYKRQVQGY